VLVQTAALAAEHDGRGSGQLDTIVFMFAALVESVNPVAAFLQVREGVPDIHDADHGQIGQRAGGSACDGLRKPDGSAFRNNDGGGAGCMRGADDGAEIVRVLDAVDDYMQAAVGSGGFFQRRVFFGRAERHDTLMRHSFARPIEAIARFETHRNFAFPAEVDDLLNSGRGHAPGDHDIVEGAPGPESLPDGMDSRERRHYDKGTPMSASENVPIQPSHEIPDKLYFRIGEVARLAGIKPYVLRFWETEFPSLGPKKSGTGHRLYRRKEVELVLEIKRLLYEKRFTIEGARRSMETRGKGEAARTVKPAKKEKARQSDLFADQPSMFETVRNELRALAEMLK
jgi:DNA-binding transcriptional MerR regulator